MQFIRLASNMDLFQQTNTGEKDKVRCFRCGGFFNPYGVDESQFMWIDDDSPRAGTRLYCTACKDKELSEWVERRSRRLGLYMQ